MRTSRREPTNSWKRGCWIIEDAIKARRRKAPMKYSCGNSREISPGLNPLATTPCRRLLRSLWHSEEQEFHHLGKRTFEMNRLIWNADAKSQRKIIIIVRLQPFWTTMRVSEHGTERTQNVLFSERAKHEFIQNIRKRQRRKKKNERRQIKDTKKTLQQCKNYTFYWPHFWQA